MKKYLEKRLAKLTAKRDALAARAKDTQDINELRSINAQIDDINGDISDINEQIADIDAANTRGAADPVPAAGATAGAPAPRSRRHTVTGSQPYCKI